MTSKYVRGSNWSKWDLHVHTPSSIVNGYGGDTDEAWSRFLDELESLPKDFKVIGINDYWFLDGYKKVVQAREAGRLPNLDAVFPVLEMRVEQFGGVEGDLSRVNVHVIFDPDLDVNVIEQQFIGQLSGRFKLSADADPSLWDGAVTRDSLADLGRKIKASVPKDKVRQFDSDLIEGFNNLNVSFDNIRELTAGSYLNKRTLIGIGKTEWSDIRWNGQSIGSKKNVISNADLLFTAFADSSTWQRQVQSLRNQNVNDRLLDCSDAHYWADSTETMRIGNCNTWINSTPTLVGLAHALKEFDHRVFVGLEPPSRKRTNENPGRFLKEFSVTSDSKRNYTAFGYSLPLNPGFVAIVGNKGQGKSALLDMIALSGNSSRNSEFAFLTPKRFLSGGGKTAAHYEAGVEWANDTSRRLKLNESYDRSSPVLVEYLPQAYVERICTTDPSSSDADEFESELREILFTHIPDDDRAGERSFDALLARKTRAAQDVLERLRGALKPLIRDYASIAHFRAENVETDIDAKLAKKKAELKAAQADLEAAEVEVRGLAEQSSDDATYDNLKLQAEDLQKNIDQLVLSRVQIEQAIAKVEQDRLTMDALSQRAVSLSADAVDINSEAEMVFGQGSATSTKPYVLVEVDTSRLTAWAQSAAQEQRSRREAITDIEVASTKHRDALAAITNELATADGRRELARQRVLQIGERIKNISGSTDDSESVNGLEELKRLVRAAPEQLAAARKGLLDQVGLVLGAIEGQLASVSSLYGPASAFIGNSKTISKASLEFKAGVQIVPAWYNLQSLIDGRKSPSLGAWMSGLPERVEVPTWTALKGEFEELLTRLESERGEMGGDYRDPSMTLRSGVALDSFLTELCDLNWLEVRFGLTGEGLPLAQLSPGQRGLVLALFYLVVDTRTTPLLLDQPEENLDNETITSLLVPAIREAAGRRQTIVVTHNPNLAIVGDADQSIQCEFRDRIFSVTSGAISEVDIATFAVNVLEGTKPAFDTRKQIYDSFPSF